MDRYRLITSIVVLFIYLLAMFPVQTIVITIVIGIAYYVLSNMGQGRLGDISTANNGREVRRRSALQTAKIYLSPYKDIWRNLKLTNKYCTLRLGSDGSTITARDLVIPNRSFRVISSRVHSNTDLWDMFCAGFAHNTTFDELVQLCKTFFVDIDIQGGDTDTPTQQNVVYSQNTANNNVRVDIQTPQKETKEKLDINNASEVEITALPGISIVMAKKLIKRREEIGGFKSVDDICLFLHLKPHIENQLRELICINKMKGSLQIVRNKERSVDL